MPPNPDGFIAERLRQGRLLRFYITNYTSLVKIAMMSLHMSDAPKSVLVNKDNKLHDVPRLKAIQEERDAATAMIADISKKIESLLKTFKILEEGRIPEGEAEVEAKVKAFKGEEEEEVKIEREIKMED